MKILVTGGLGFIGSAVIRHLLTQTAHAVVNLDKVGYAASPDALAPFAGDPRYAHVRADLLDPAALAELFAVHRPDAVMHLAAETHVDRAIDGPRGFVATNVMGTCNLLEAVRDHLGSDPARRAAFRFHHVSTDEVFGALGPEDPPFTADTPYRPRNPYSASKAASDHLVRAWGETYGLPVLVSNTCNNYGPWQFPEKLIPLTTIAAIEGRPLPVYGKGENVRDWIHVEDHAEALVRVLAHGRIGSTYCIGAGAEHRNIDVVHAICDALDRLRPDPAGPHRRLITHVADRPGHDFRYAIDAGPAQAALGWAPRRDFAAGIADTVRWYLDHAPWWRAINQRRYGGERLGLGQG